MHVNSLYLEGLRNTLWHHNKVLYATILGYPPRSKRMSQYGQVKMSNIDSNVMSSEWILCRIG